MNSRSLIHHVFQRRVAALPLEGTPAFSVLPGEARVAALLRPHRIVLVLCLGLLLFQAWSLRNGLLDPNYISDDYRQNLFWLPQLLDPGSFANDLIAEYMRDFNPPGLIALYALFMNLGLSPLACAKIFSVLIYFTSLAGVWTFGASLPGIPENREKHWLCGSFLLLFAILNNRYFLEFTMGGLARTTAFPLQIWFLVAITRSNFTFALLIGVLASVFHPQSFMVSAGSLLLIEGWGLLRVRSGRRPRRPYHLRLALVVLGALLFSMPWMLKSQRMQDKYGTMITSGEIATIPEYQLGGRWEEEKPLNPWLTLVQEVDGQWPLTRAGSVRFDTQQRIAVILYGSFLFWAVWGWRYDRQRIRGWHPIWITAGVALGLFLLAYPLIPRLYFPNRFLRPIIPLIVVGFLAARVVQGSPWKRGPGLTMWRLWCATLFIAVMMLFDRSKSDLGFSVDARALAPVAESIRNTPRDSVIAAYPKSDADSLAVLGERSVFVQREASHPLYSNYNDEMRERTKIAILAQFPINGDSDMEELIRRKVDYLLVNKTLLRNLISSGRTPSFDQPYKARMLSRLSPLDGIRIQAYWNERWKDRIVFEDESYWLMDLSPASPPDHASPSQISESRKDGATESLGTAGIEAAVATANFASP